MPDLDHFMLVNVFAQHYNPAFAATDMGVAYVTEPEKEVFGHYERVSVKDTYDRIRKGFGRRLALMISNKAYGDTPKYHSSWGRPRLLPAVSIGEWQKAIEAADEALGDNPTLRKVTKVYRMSITGRKTILQLRANLLLASTVSRVCRGSVVLSLRVFYGRQQFPVPAK